MIDRTDPLLVSTEAIPLRGIDLCRRFPALDRHLRATWRETELSRCRRHERVLSVVFADVDFFKQFNDRQGHLAGDEVLANLAKLITSMSRKSTIVARYGGEEFVLLAPETAREGSLMYAEKLRTAVASHPFQGRETQPGGRVTMSLG